MKHPSWCEEDDCEAGWHRLSASYSNGGLARIEVRLCQNIENSEFELDLGRDGSDGYNTISEMKSIKLEISDLTSFRDNLNLIIDAIDKVKKT
jgi:hypothetical protein